MRNLICICCPRGCHLTVDDEMNVTGNFCPRGKTYALNEVTHPTRMITSTVQVLNGEISRVPCVTSSPIPKEKIFEVMEVIHATKIEAPVKVSQVLIPDILGLGVDIIAARNIERK